MSAEGLATLARVPLGGATVAALATDYVDRGWQCDRAALDGMQMIGRGGDAALIGRVIRALYEPWLEASARNLQDLLGAADFDTAGAVTTIPADRETCLLFADGLRFDVAALVQERLELRGARTRLRHRIAGIPSVTATCKPLGTPVADAFEGNPGRDDFAPTHRASRQPMTAARLRDALARNSVDVLEAAETPGPTGSNMGGWTEAGRLDELGHSLGVLLARQIDDEIESLADRTLALLNAGWTRVRIVTDHGWLLLPEGLTKVELPPTLVDSKWARCATVQGGSTPSIPVWPWHWNGLVQVASPPGAGSFFANTCYAHGGISPQESIIPDLTVERGAEAVTAEITGIVWRGMRCRITVRTNAPGARIDLRRHPRQSETTIAAAVKPVGTKGETSLVTDDRHEGVAASVVVLDTAGEVLAHKLTEVGAE